MSPVPVAALFDMDGTLLTLPVDIEEVRQRLAALFAPHGVTRPFRPLLARLREAIEEAGRRGANRRALERRGRQIVDDAELEAARAARARPGAAAVVATLAGRGVRLGLVTDNGRACVGPALASAGIPAAVFAALATRDDVAAPKPDPGGVLAAAAALAPAEVLWYVGDHPKDVLAGKAAAVTLRKLRVAAVRGGLATDAELARAGAHVVLADVAAAAELPGLG